MNWFVSRRLEAQGSGSDVKQADAVFNNSFVPSSSRFSRRRLALSATRTSDKGSATRSSRRAACAHCRAVWHVAPRFGATILHAFCLEIFSARVRPHPANDAVLRILVKFSLHFPNFPIYSNGTNLGHFSTGRQPEGKSISTSLKR